MYKGSPTVLPEILFESLKSLKSRNPKTRKVGTMTSNILYTSCFNHVKLGRKISSKLTIKLRNDIPNIFIKMLNKYYRHLLF